MLQPIASQFGSYRPLRICPGGQSISECLRQMFADLPCVVAESDDFGDVVLPEIKYQVLVNPCSAKSLIEYLGTFDLVTTLAIISAMLQAKQYGITGLPTSQDLAVFKVQLQDGSLVFLSCASLNGEPKTWRMELSLPSEEVTFVAGTYLFCPLIP